MFCLFLEHVTTTATTVHTSNGRVSFHCYFTLAQKQAPLIHSKSYKALVTFTASCNPNTQAHLQPKTEKLPPLNTQCHLVAVIYEAHEYPTTIMLGKYLEVPWL